MAVNKSIVFDTDLGTVRMDQGKAGRVEVLVQQFEADERVDFGILEPADVEKLLRFLAEVKVEGEIEGR